MSTVNASNSNNPYASVQALWQRGQSQSSAAQGDAPSQPFTVTSQSGANAPSSTAAASSGGAASASGGTFPRFEPQTLEALLALQTTGS